MTNPVRKAEPVVIELPEPPTANKWWRYRRGQQGKGGHGQMYLSESAKAYKSAVWMLCGKFRRFDGGVLFDASTEIALSVFWRRGALRTPNGGLYYAGDLDKRLGVLLDALQGSIYVNDSQVVELHAFRLDAPENSPGSVKVEARTL